MNELVIPKTLLDFCAARGRVLSKITQAYGLLEKADVELRSYYSYGLPHSAKPRDGLDSVTRELDRDLWRTAFDKTGFMQLMDAEAKSKFMAEVEANPPEFNEGNIRATFLSLAQDADKMYARGIVNVFLKLSKHHKTNTSEPFKVNERAVLSHMVQQEWQSTRVRVHYSHHASEKLNDIDRVFKTLDNKKHEPRALEHAVNAAFRGGAKLNFYEDEYYQIRGFLNGNTHIRFKRTDLLDKANRIIHDYYHGQALAAAKGPL